MRDEIEKQIINLTKAIEATTEADRSATLSLAVLNLTKALEVVRHVESVGR